MKWKHFPRHWPFVWGNHRPPVNSPHKGQWRGTLMFSLICASINGWVNNREAGDLRHHRVHYGVSVMTMQAVCCCWFCLNLGVMFFEPRWHFCTCIYDNLTNHIPTKSKSTEMTHKSQRNSWQTNGYKIVSCIFAVVTLSEFDLEISQIWIEFEFKWTDHYWNGLQTATRGFDACENTPSVSPTWFHNIKQAFAAEYFPSIFNKISLIIRCDTHP